MTLAVIFLASIFCAPSPAKAGPPTSQSTPPAQTNSTPATQDTGTAPTPQNPPTQPPAPSTASPSTAPSNKPTATTPRTGSKKARKKKPPPANCDPNAAPAPAASSGGATSTDPATGSVSNTGALPPCPPPKVVVQHGGTSETSIQVAGSATGEQTSQQRNTANEMLDVANGNLKKISGRQLSPEQQDMVSQIHQFMDQSKAAVKDGDLERARTLAWKAQLLSEELVKPEK
jgi:hypothetical protein